jgi:uncharacterized protein YjbK
MAAPTKAGSLSELDPAIQKVEFKLTVRAKDESKVHDMLAGAKPVQRKVYFYDTPRLDLDDRTLVLRARVTDGEEDSTVKLRPVPLPVVPPPWSDDKDVEIELDVVGTKDTASAKLDGKPDPGEIEQVERRTRKLSKLFSKAQEALIDPALPDGTSLDDLEVLGPIAALKWELRPDGFPYKLAVEEWTITDGPHFIELSFKVAPSEAETAQQAFQALLDGRDIGRRHRQKPKTRMVLEHFAQKLRQ